jgi:hypothetical protein
VTQTVEGGWQHYPGKYGATSKSVLFIYWTADSYTRTGCYNLDCAGFVQTNNNIRLGGGFSRYSTVGGAQYELWLQWFRSGGNWWMYLGGTAVGYYPASLWANTGLARGATTIDYGGETTGDGNYPAMGSGRFAAAGAKQAAYQQLVEYFDTGNKRRIASLSPDQRTPRCYTINLRNNSPTASKTYFYYGGPGGRVC